MNNYPLDDWEYHGFYSPYVIAHILGIDYNSYLKMTGWLARAIGTVNRKFNKTKYQSSKDRRIINGWLFIKGEIIDKYLKRMGWPSLSDIFDKSRPSLLISEHSFEYFKLSKKIADFGRIYPDIQRNIHTISKELYKITRNRVVIKRRLYKISRIK